MSSNDPIHFMVDLETLDTTSTAVILSIGVCTVHDASGGPQLYIELDPARQYMRTKSLETIAWWESQGDCPDKGTSSLEFALCKLTEYLHSITTKPIVWCKGTDFDISILTNAYKQVGLTTPWKYNDVRDFRTIKKMFGDSMVVTIENPQPHHALADAIYQAQQLHSIGLELK